MGAKRHGEEWGLYEAWGGSGGCKRYGEEVGAVRGMGREWGL